MFCITNRARIKLQQIPVGGYLSPQSEGPQWDDGRTGTEDTITPLGKEFTPMASETKNCAPVPEAEDTCCCRRRNRTPAEIKKLSNRLSRIEGQIRGIRGMIERDAYCPDILIQVAAANIAILKAP